jgi:ribokinase
MTQVVVVGNATVDVIQRVERFARTGETLLCSAMVVCAGGKGLNQAVAAARTGAPTQLHAPVAADAHGELLARAVAAEPGLQAHWLIVLAPTDISTIWIDTAGDNMIVSAAAAAAAMDSAYAAAACESLGIGDVLLVQGNLSQEATEAAIERAHARGALVVLNTAPIRSWMAGLLAKVDVVIANAVEAAELSGGSAEPEAALLREGARAAVISLGGDGAVLATKTGRLQVAAPIVTALDTSGAGDVLAGTIAGLLARGITLEAALQVAVAAASISVTQPGTTPSFPSRDAVAALCKARAVHLESNHA